MLAKPIMAVGKAFEDGKAHAVAFQIATARIAAPTLSAIENTAAFRNLLARGERRGSSCWSLLALEKTASKTASDFVSGAFTDALERTVSLLSLVREDVERRDVNSGGGREAFSSDVPGDASHIDEPTSVERVEFLGLAGIAMVARCL